MSSTNYNISRKARNSLIIVLIGTFLATFYPVINRESLNSILNGFIIGLLGSSFIALNEVIMDRKRIRKLKFKLVIFYKTAVYTIFFGTLIPLVVSISRSIDTGVSFDEFILSGGLHHYLFEEDFHVIMIYALFATSLFIFTYQLSKKMGQGMLWNFIIGKYHEPRHEELVFMFLDLNNSTTIAEEIGDLEFNSLLNEFILDITDSIVSNSGKIYRYVGDEVVVYWETQKGKQSARYLKTFFDAKNAIEENASEYEKRYGMVPNFTAGFSQGKVIAGEIGRVKSQISFFGNALFETAQLEKSCRKFGVELLVSGPLLKETNLPKEFEAKKEGVINTSFGTEVDVYSITKN